MLLVFYYFTIVGLFRNSVLLSDIVIGMLRALFRGITGVDRDAFFRSKLPEVKLRPSNKSA